MKRLLSLSIFLLLSANTLLAQKIEPEKIIGKWQLKSFDTIDMIRSSPGYLNSPEHIRKEMDEKSDKLLSNTVYNFMGLDSLVYTDLQGDKIVERRAIYNIRENYLTLKELDRPYSRQAKLLKLEDDILIFTPVVNGKDGKGKMVFERINEE